MILETVIVVCMGLVVISAWWMWSTTERTIPGVNYEA